jgi:hypothetical protein
MNDLITNRLNTIKSCINVAQATENQAVWQNQAPLAFADELASLAAGHRSAVELAARAASAASGHADAKDAAEEALETACHKTSRALASHFKKTGDLTRLARVDHKLGYYQKLRDTHLIATLRSACDTFTAADPTPRAGIVQRSTLLRELAAAVADLDDLVIQYDTTEAGRTFISAWKQARAIVDSGHGPGEQPAPPAPNP